ncbi:MAG TPA: gamma-glutamyltransferase, partial [Saprospiraceae bacterium]|nr:gamma-glutamyltransferase [Saprospiraceae bacterium]
VVYPEAGNIGGGGFMVYKPAKADAITLDFREKAPIASSKDMYLDKNGDPVPDLSPYGNLSVGVPGSIDGLFTMFEKYSALKDFSKLIEPSIRLAENGFAITEREANNLNTNQSLFRQYNSYPVPFVKDKPWVKEDILKQIELSQTFKRIQKYGRREFYEGETSKLMLDCMQVNKGIIKPEDLKTYQSIWRVPLVSDYKGYSIITMPPPSSGGIALIQLLKMVDVNNIDKLGFHTTESIHLSVEAERRVYADRATYLGDPDFYKVPVKTLISDSYLKTRMSGFNTNIATPSDLITAGVIALPEESHETTHFSIIDKDGNAVSITTTLNSAYGSKVVVKGAGFILNNEMDDFSCKPGLANQFGLIGGEANCIAPNKRMLSSMTPTIVTKNDKVYCVVGSPGGSTIITTVYQIICNLINFRMKAEDAVQSPRFHSQWLPDEIQFEEEMWNELLLVNLEKKGHKLKKVAHLGKVEAIVKYKGDEYIGIADKRGDDDVAYVK